MVEVFKTNVYTETDAQMLRGVITNHYPGYKISFDLDDCDKVLRIEGESIDSTIIIDLVSNNAYSCSMLE